MRRHDLLRRVALRAALSTLVLTASRVAVSAAAQGDQGEVVVRALSHFRAGELAAAGRIFEFLQARRPAEPSFMSILSEIERRLRNLQRAELWAKRAIAQAPTSGLGQVALAELYHTYGRHAEALQFARNAVAGTEPDAPSLLAARELLELGRAEEAVEAVSRAEMEYAERSRNPPPSAWVDPVAAEWVDWTERMIATGTAKGHDVVRLYQALEGKFPESFRLLGLAGAWVELGDSLRAGLMYDSFAITAPDDAILLTIGVQEALADGRVRATATMLARLTATEAPLNTGVLGIGLGNLVFQDLRELAPAVETQARKFADLPELRLILGVVRRQEGDEAGADSAFDRALALAPQDPGALTSRGQELRAVTAYRQAEQAARRALELDPANLAAQELLALTLTDMERYREALEVRWRVLARDTAEAAHAFGFGSLALKVDTAFAADTLRKLLPRFGGRRSAALRVNLAQALAALGDTARAVAHYDSAVADDTTWAGSYARRAEFREKRGDLEGAIRDVETAVQRDSTNGHQIHNLARLYLLAHRIDQALASAQRAHGLDATDWDTHFYFALGLRALGSTAPAQDMEYLALSMLSRGEPWRRQAVDQALDQDLARAARLLDEWAGALPHADAWNWKRLSLEHWAEATDAIARFRKR